MPAQTIQYTKTYKKAYGSKAFRLNVTRKEGNGSLSYTTSNKKVATVDKNGKVTIKTTGIAVITIKAAKTAQYKETSVKVTVKVRPKKQIKPTVTSKTGRKLKVT